MHVQTSETKSKNSARWNRLAVIVWSVTLLAVAIRPALPPKRGTVLDTYAEGGWHWAHGEPVYRSHMGFVYSPIAAAFFTPFAYIPAWPRWVLFLAINAGVFLVGIAAMLRAGLYPKIRQEHYWAAFLLPIPIALPSLDVAQANPLLIGLLMLAITAVRAENWNAAAIFVALAAYLKIYPIVVGLLILLIAPKKFGWRLLTALVLLGLLPFLLQHREYVCAQYHAWFVTRTADNRLQYSERHAPLDLWLLLVRIGGLGIKPWFYRCIQVASGAAIALYCILVGRKGWPRPRMLAGLFSLTCVWIMLCGPATEGFTYAMLAPPVVLALVQAYAGKQPAWLRRIALTSFALLVLAVIKNGLLAHLNRYFWMGAMQPVAALVFLLYCLFWLFDDSNWIGASTIETADLPEVVGED